MKQFFYGLSIFFVGVSLLGAFAATPAQAACADRFLTFPTWYRGVNDGSAQCNIVVEDEDDGLSNFIWTIVLNVVEIMIQAVAYIAVGYILWGAYTYMRSVGDPSKLSRAKDMITNAIIGLVISLIAIVVITFIVATLAPSPTS